jgi:hypothetical protein
MIQAPEHLTSMIQWEQIVGVHVLLMHPTRFVILSRKHLKIIDTSQGILTEGEGSVQLTSLH